MKRNFAALILLCALLSFASSGEGTYERIEMDMTRAELDALFAGSEEGEYVAYGDALCAFYENGRLMAKSRRFDDVRKLAPLTEASFDRVRALKYGTRIDVLRELLGEGLEIMLLNLSDEEGSGRRRLLCWQDAAGSVMEALFELDDGKWILFALGEVKADGAAIQPGERTP